MIVYPSQTVALASFVGEQMPELLKNRIELILFREDHNLKQVDITKLLGYNVHSWRDYESGRRKIPAHVLKSIEMYTKLNPVD